MHVCSLQRNRVFPKANMRRSCKPRRVPDWETVRIFLEVLRSGSFRAASDRLGQSINALRRKVDELEHTLGVILLTRHVDGVRPTAEGEKIQSAALRMEAASFDLLQARNSAKKDVEGEVRLAVTEGLGTFWLAPRLVEFQRANPKLMVHLNCAMKSADVLRLEADVSIQLERPVAPDLRMAKIGRIHAMFFAAKSYLDTYGYPKSVADLKNHRLVIQSDGRKRSQELYDQLFPGVSPIGLVSLRSNVASAHYWSIAKGAGIGMLATYAQAIGAQLVPLDLGVVHPIWTSGWPITLTPNASRALNARSTGLSKPSIRSDFPGSAMNSFTPMTSQRNIGAICW